MQERRITEAETRLRFSGDNSSSALQFGDLRPRGLLVGGLADRLGALDEHHLRLIHQHDGGGRRQARINVVRPTTTPLVLVRQASIY